jgi:hypothetical protein
MTRAYMSTNRADNRRTREIEADQRDGVSATFWGGWAELEARAILAETEPSDWYRGEPVVAYLDVSVAGWMSRELPSVDVCQGGVALAEALAAVLPVLDELEAQARQR